MTVRKAVANKKYMIIAVSVLIAEFTARNNGGAVRQESNPQSATTYISERYAQLHLARQTDFHANDNESGKIQTVNFVTL